MKSVGLSITGAILSAIGGFLIGFASGINYVVMEIVFLTPKIVSLFPVIGPEITNYIQSQLTNDLAGYYVVGALFLIVGLLVVSVYGGKKKTSPKSMAPPAAVPTTTQRFCTKCGNRLGIDDRFCSSCGQAIS